MTELVIRLHTKGEGTSGQGACLRLNFSKEMQEVVLLRHSQAASVVLPKQRIKWNKCCLVTERTLINV